MLPGFLRRAAVAGLLVAAVVGAARAQFPAELRGRVSDALSGAPIENVLIEVVGTGFSTFSDGRGEFHLRGLEPGRYTLRLTRLGYAALTRGVTIRNGEVTPVTLRLGVQPVLVEAVAAEIDRTLPGAIAIERAEIEASGALTAANILEDRAGLVLRRNGPNGAQTLSIRGSDAGEVLVLLDGAPLGSAITGEADLSTIPAAQIESITVLKGSQSARYGPGAEAGAVLIETRITTSPVGLNLGSGSLGAWHGGMEASGDAGGFAWSAGAQYRTLHGRFDYAQAQALGGGQATRRNSDLDEGSGFITGAARIAGGRLRARIAHTRTERGLPGRSFSPSPAAREQLSRWHGQTSWERLLGRARLTAQLHAVSQEARFRDPDPPAGLAFDSRTDALTLGGRLAAEVASAGALESLSGGVELRSQRYESAALDPSAPDGRLDVGAFLSAQSTLATAPASPTLIAAARLDHDDLDRVWRATHELTARASFGAVSLYARHASSFSPPTFGDQFFKEGVAVEPNPQLRAERIPSELGLGGGLEAPLAAGTVGRLAVDAYLADVKDMIIWAPDFRFVWSPRNFDIKRRGFDAEAELSLDGGVMRLGARYSYNRATYDRAGDDSVQVIYRPRHTGGVSVNWSPARWQLGLELAYTGTRYPVPAPLNALEPFWTVDLRARRAFDLGAWRLTPALYLDRLFDNEDSLIFGFPEPGRTVRLEVSAARR